MPELADKMNRLAGCAMQAWRSGKVGPILGHYFRVCSKLEGDEYRCCLLTAGAVGVSQESERDFLGEMIGDCDDPEKRYRIHEKVRAIVAEHFGITPIEVDAITEGFDGWGTPVGATDERKAINQFARQVAVAVCGKSADTLASVELPTFRPDSGTVA